MVWESCLPYLPPESAAVGVSGLVVGERSRVIAFPSRLACSRACRCLAWPPKYQRGRADPA